VRACVRACVGVAQSSYLVGVCGFARHKQACVGLRERSSYTVHTRLRRNERLGIVGLQQTDVRDCREPLLQKGSKTHAQRALNAKNGRNQSEGGITQSAGWKAMLASLLSGTSSCTDATHTCRQGAVVQYKKQSRHTHQHEQGNLVPHHTQAAATHNHHWLSQERLVGKQPIMS
jgi:hypothetical protein